MQKDERLSNIKNLLFIYYLKYQKFIKLSVNFLAMITQFL